MNDDQLEMIAAALPNYELGGELGRGSFGVVLGARHRRLGRDVAIKQLPPALASDPEVQARFFAEAQVLAALQHPHIVPVYDFVEHQGLCLLVMERLPGGTVGDRIAGDGIGMEAACAIAMVTCAGLHSAHQHGVLHRDVKPDNLMFSANGVLKVVDFGIAKMIGTTRTLATLPGGFLGTPAYMAPEQVEGKELGPAADVYGTGVLLYELLTKQLPFSEEGGVLITAYRHLHDDPLPITEIMTLPSSLAEVTMKALARAPEDRFHTSMEFGVAIGQAATAAFGVGWLERTGIRVLEAGPILDSALEFRGPAPPSLTPTRVEEAQETARSTTRRRPLPDTEQPSEDAPRTKRRARKASPPRQANEPKPSPPRQAKEPKPPAPPQAKEPKQSPRRAKEPKPSPPRQAKEPKPPPEDAGRRKRVVQRALLIGVPVVVVVVLALVLGGGSDAPGPTEDGTPYSVTLAGDQVSLHKGGKAEGGSLETQFALVTDDISGDRLRELQSGQVFSNRQDAVAYMDLVRTEAESAVVMRDGFTSNDVEGRAWPVTDDGTKALSFVEGSYRVVVKSPDGALDIRAPIAVSELPVAISIEVDATSVGTAPARFGLFCRSSGSDSFPEYLTYVGADGSWQIVRVNEDRTFTVLAPTTPSERSPAIKPEAPNRLRLDCAGGDVGAPVTLSLYANGQKIVDAQDPNGLPLGLVGLSVASSADGPGEMQFDDFVVKRR